MKLLSKTNLYFGAASLLVFTVGGVLFFVLFQRVIDRDIDKKLLMRKNYVTKQLAQSDSLMLYQSLSANTIKIKATKKMDFTYEVFSDTALYDVVDRNTIHYRQLSFNIQTNGRSYHVQLRRAIVETSDLAKGVVILEILLFLGFMAILSMLNSQLSKRIWMPFYDMLNKINSYKIDQGESLRFEPTSITEFNELAHAIEMMSKKISQEFMSQREFTENASHEIQTPLAIIKNKLELLLQIEGLNEEQFNLISTASTACNRLSKLNEALIILSKIENRHFHAVETICVNDLIESQLDNLEELVRMKRISVRKFFHEKLPVKMNRFLADIMFENLITNAIKHNFSPGFLSITIQSNMIMISNTGDESRQKPEQLFHRFVKGDSRSKSLGLGLSIIKAICDTYLLPILYTVDNQIHVITIKFPENGSP